MKKQIIIHYPRFEESKYTKILLNYVKDLRSIIQNNLLDKLPYLLNDRDEYVRVDDFLDDIENIIDSLNVSISQRTLSFVRLLRSAGFNVSRFTSRQVARILSSNISIETQPDMGIDFINNPLSRGVNELLKSWVYTNTRLIKSIEENLLDNVSLVIQDGFRSGSTIQVIKNQLKQKFDITENRAKLIARDQIGKLHSNIVRNQMLNLRISEYRWLTSKDDRVRDSHKVMNGKICSWTDPTIYKDSEKDKKWNKRISIGGVEKQVGEDYQCRCAIIAIVPR